MISDLLAREARGEGLTLGNEFPVELETLVLDAAAMKARYGLATGRVPPKLQEEVNKFVGWCLQAVRLDRNERYGSVQSTTIEKQLGCIRAYMGHLVKYQHVQAQELSLTHYQRPSLFAMFLSFLVARGAGAAHLSKHISLGRKANDYLLATTSQSSDSAQLHAAKVDIWLKRLASNLAKSMAKPELRAIPPLNKVWSWVDKLCKEALDTVRQDRAKYGRITPRTAKLVQAAIIANLVTGATVPPVRLSILRAVVHPKYVQARRCQDPDCQVPGNICLGNRFEVVPIDAYEESEGQYMTACL